MALDPLGNYYAALPDEVRGSGTGTLKTIGTGTGAPDGSTKVATIYIDIATGTIYAYANGGWVAAGGSGGLQGVVYTSGTPANPPDITKNAIAYDPNGFLPILGWGTISHTWGAA